LEFWGTGVYGVLRPGSRVLEASCLERGVANHFLVARVKTHIELSAGADPADLHHTA